MGDPKKQHKHYDSVKRPWDKDRIMLEKKIVSKYGIRRKKELRKAETILRNLRQRARALIGSHNQKEESMLLKKTHEQGLTEKEATLDTILSLKIESVLERRLQTMLLKKSLANTPLQARQFIAHGHIAVENVKVISPSYLVKIHEENSIGYIPKSNLKNTFKPADKEKEDKKTKPAEKAGKKEHKEEHAEKEKHDNKKDKTENKIKQEKDDKTKEKEDKKTKAE